MKFDKVNLLKSTALAYVGDSVFTLYVRSKLTDPHLANKTLITKSAHMVSAVVQSKIYDEIAGCLDAEEQALCRRCINTHLNNRAKNATMEQYKKATALEGLFGALYLSDERERLSELLKKSFEIGETL